MKKQSKTPVRGYKVFNPDFTCRDVKFAVGKEFKHKGEIIMCQVGFHFCLKASHCFEYYSFDPKNIVCEVEALGKILTHDSDSKICTDHLKVIRQLTWQEVLMVANEGKDNTGHSNSGDCNSGYRNSGDRNSGNCNSGDCNSGNRNSGYWNSGNRNSGDCNSGDCNSGNRNSGYRNSGDRNSGDRNSGDCNSGDRNSGDCNSGDCNSGYRNSGDCNSGDWNSGDCNSGNRNSGYWNSGYRNSGDCNSGYRNSGAFCTDTDPFLYLFNKKTNIKVREWENMRPCQIMNNLDLTVWVQSNIMTPAEKTANPKWETTEGYLKTISYKEAWANLWGNLSDSDKKEFTKLPNFDSKIFMEITGINVTQ